MVSHWTSFVNIDEIWSRPSERKTPRFAGLKLDDKLYSTAPSDEGAVADRRLGEGKRLKTGHYLRQNSIFNLSFDTSLVPILGTFRGRLCQRPEPRFAGLVYMDLVI